MSLLHHKIMMGAFVLLGGRGYDTPLAPPMSRRYPERPKPTKCLLPHCAVLTTHNGGYCSAEHCKLDRERRKAK